MYTIGATGIKIGELASGDVQSCGSLLQAVTAARENMQEGDVLLLSPGCASWDQFDNYEQRGEEFCSLVTSHS
jgi:UDP-N-acetylmuramoylalanine--D-glutamate ligase